MIVSGHPSHCQHFVIARVLSAPYEVAHQHLVSQGSPGITSTAVRLAAHLSNFITCQITASLIPTSNESQLDLFKSELVSAYTRAGVKVSMPVL